MGLRSALCDRTRRHPDERNSLRPIRVVDTLLSPVGKGAPLFDPGIALLTHFSANPRVRQYALQTWSGRAPPLGALARAYENDAGIRPQILACANPLPVTLRGDIAEVASGEANSRPAFERMLEGYDIEVDSELKIAASTYYHRYIAGGPSAVHLKELVDALHAVGPDMNERRAAAFAGMLLLGRVKDIAPMTEYGDKPLNIRSGPGYGKGSDSLMALMCERLEDVRQAFGADLAARFGNFGADDGHLWDCLAPHINASPAARRDFLAFCSETDTTLGLRSFVTLAREQPSSELLLDHCWRVFGARGVRSAPAPFFVGRTAHPFGDCLYSQRPFPNIADERERLQEALKRGSAQRSWRGHWSNRMIPCWIRFGMDQEKLVSGFRLGNGVASRIRPQQS